MTGRLPVVLLKLAVLGIGVGTGCARPTERGSNSTTSSVVGEPPSPSVDASATSATASSRATDTPSGGNMDPQVMTLTNDMLSVRSRLPDHGELTQLRGRTDFSILILGSGLALEDEELALIPELPAVKALVLDGQPIRGLGLRHLTRLANLDGLHLSRTRIESEGLNALCRLPKLTNLRLDHTKLNDKGLKAITCCPALRVLEIRGTQVTKKGVKVLRAVKTLERLEVSDLPYEVVVAARKYLPGVDVSYPEEYEETE